MWRRFYTVTAGAGAVLATALATRMPVCPPLALALYLVEAAAMVASMWMLSHPFIDIDEYWL